MKVLLGMTAAVLLAASAVHAAPVQRDAKLWAAAEQARPAQLALLEQAVNIDSGTGDVAGGERLTALLVPHLKAAGLAVELVPAEAPGLPPNVVGSVSGRGKGRILLIGHLDTVFEPGTAARRPFRIEGDRAYGPGVGDEKAGVIGAIAALRILRYLGFRDFAQITLLLETSEERGSPGARKLINRLLSEADVELNLEPGSPPDAVTVWRKGSATYVIEVKGAAAHAGVNPQEGRNAAVELIHQVQAADVFPKSGEGLTANLTVMSAGRRHNIIPEDASAAINVRVREKADFDKVEAVLRANAQTPVVPGVQVTVRRDSAYPPMFSNPATDALAAQAQRIYAELGLTLRTAGSGGASESALALEAGKPALDGLGPVGAEFHADGEFINLTTLTPRLYLLTRLIMELGARPPAPLK